MGTSTGEVIENLWKNYKECNKQGFRVDFKFGNTTIELKVRDNLTESAFKYSVSSLVNDCAEYKVRNDDE